MTPGFTVAAHAQLTLSFRIGLPVGTPHDGDSNGGTPYIKLRSNVTALDGSWVLQASDTHTIDVDSISSTFTHVPARAVAGGAPIEFDAVLTNPTPRTM
ncbi:hypothetical protein GXW82_14215 [Streptacidiphilus sp. 4-A2]|nr:hypothetical protein [Streptacidiphilus sp. 4-A2]